MIDCNFAYCCDCLLFRKPYRFHTLTLSVEHKEQLSSMCKCLIHAVSKIVSGEAL